MKWKEFHHPNISMPVIRRRVASEFLHLLGTLGAYMATSGRSLIWEDVFTNRTAYRAARYRLRKAGLAVEKESPEGRPTIKLTERGRASLPMAFNPEKLWNQKWNGFWYILLYDIPESDRCYRNTLRNFLKRMKMGGLQRSVWITPRDISPDYYDLIKAADLDRYAQLFESRTVLGDKSSDLVWSAWDFNRINGLQYHFLRACEENAEHVAAGRFNREDLLELARDQVTAYLQVMEPDPLLPKSLWPDGYCGAEMIRAHNGLLQEIGSHIQA